MAVDITKIAENDLVRILGTGDWLIALPEPYPPLTVNATWRKDLFETIASQFVRWVIGGVRCQISHEDDPPWDTSGHMERFRVDFILMLVAHPTLDEWLTLEYTGNSRASYLSGSGLFWDTYDDDAQEEISDRLFHLLESHLRPLSDDPDDDLCWQDAYEQMSDVERVLETLLRLMIGRMKTSEAWLQYEATVRRQLADEQRQAEEQRATRQYREELAEQFWLRHFGEFFRQRIEQTKFKQHNLRYRLTELLADADPEIVEAIAAVGIPGDFSNSVCEEIKHIAQQALED